VLRFNLVPTDSTLPSTAQVLWSRSSGLVLSASQLAPPPSGRTYQIWLLNNTVPIAAGTFVPDRQGRATVVLENPADVPRPINGVMITIEPAGGARAPTGAPVLLRQTS
jgi:anti-sigma-K factor RskA